MVPQHPESNKLHYIKKNPAVVIKPTLAHHDRSQAQNPVLKTQEHCILSFQNLEVIFSYQAKQTVISGRYCI